MGNKDYIDTVVLTEKPQAVGPGPTRPSGIRQNIAVVNYVRLTRVGDVKVTSLTIDECWDNDGDPYNNTGKHCVLKAKEW